MSHKKTYSYGVNNKIQVINHVLRNKCFAWFNIREIYRIAFYLFVCVYVTVCVCVYECIYVRAHMCVCESVCVSVCECSRTVCRGIKLKAGTSGVRFPKGSLEFFNHTIFSAAKCHWDKSAPDIYEY